MDRESIESLYDSHAPRLYAIALRILGDRDAAAATLEDVFVELASGQSYDDAYGSPSARLIRLTR
ncbi:MAG TPA: RNA polymerase subunit sigma, partial [Thermoanaerobaculia bacterium]|nr:RNA polymerase subunit sigma [Thermoanaerobaculia bacterium]